MRPRSSPRRSARSPACTTPATQLKHVIAQALMQFAAIGCFHTVMNNLAGGLIKALFYDSTAAFLLRTTLGVQAPPRASTERKSISTERTFRELSEPADLRAN